MDLDGILLFFKFEIALAVLADIFFVFLMRHLRSIGDNRFGSFYSGLMVVMNIVLFLGLGFYYLCLTQ